MKTPRSFSAGMLLLTTLVSCASLELRQANRTKQQRAARAIGRFLRVEALPSGL